MKATDLMIGDFVAENNTPLQIAALGTAKTGFIDVKGFYHYYDNIEPIPLTAEILEKNGFDYNDSLAEWATDSFCIGFGHEAFKEELDHFFVWVPNCEVALNYVHELQHALKLCGIDKNIEL